MINGLNQKIGLINKITTDGDNMGIEINDLGNIFNRVPSIAPNATPDWNSATDAEELLYGWIVDNESEIPDTTSEEVLGSNIIG